MSSIRQYLHRRRRLLTIPRLNEGSGHEYLSLGDVNLARESVRWYDYPIRLLDVSTLKSTMHWNRPSALFKRIATALRRISVIDLNPFMITHPLNIPYDSLAFMLLGNTANRIHDRLRMARNKPAPLWGISARSYARKAHQQISQDAFPWCPTSCLHGDTGLVDVHLYGLMCNLGRAGARPIRLAVANCVSTVFFFGIYLASTLLYIGSYSAARLIQRRLERNHEHQSQIHREAVNRIWTEANGLPSIAPLPVVGESGVLRRLLEAIRRPTNAPWGPMGPPMTTPELGGIISVETQRVIGWFIVGSLLISIVQFFISIVLVEMNRTEVLGILQGECEVQNDLWASERKVEGDDTVRQLHVIECTDIVKRAPDPQTFVRRWYRKSSPGYVQGFLSSLKRLVKSRKVYCIRYSECSAQFVETFNRPAELPAPPSNKLSKFEGDETDDFDEDVDEMSTLPVTMVPPVHSMVMNYALFSRAVYQEVA